MKRRILYVTGTRADFGLMQSTLQKIHAHAGLELALAVTGTHVLPEFGMTVREIEQTGLPIAGRIPVDLRDADGAKMARGLAAILAGVTDIMARSRFDLVLLLGDRGEMLAAALAALHLNTPIAHVCGGERSGSIDEAIRHAISKLAHYHFVATEGAKARLERMGEDPRNVHVVGAPGVDGLVQLATRSRADLCARVGFDPSQPLAVVILHPVVQLGAANADSAVALAEAVKQSGLQAMWLLPNSDAGGSEIRTAIAAYGSNPRFRLESHLSREEYVSWLAHADVLLGNSSSGIVEAPYFGTPVVDLGDRQKLRERPSTVTSCEVETTAIVRAAQSALKRGRLAPEAIYGQGNAAATIAHLLATLPLAPSILTKGMPY